MQTFIKEIIIVSIITAPIVMLYLTGRPKKVSGAIAKAVAWRKFAVINAVVFAALSVPIYFHSASSYSFYSKEEASLKVAFKHSGRRVVDCDERELIKKVGERYRKSLKENKRADMNIEGLSGCPRERFPVAMRISIDDKQVLDKRYAPDGIKKDLASYISEEFITAPGVHRITVALSEKGDIAVPEYILDEVVDMKPGGVMAIFYDDRVNKLVVE